MTEEATAQWVQRWRSAASQPLAVAAGVALVGSLEKIAPYFTFWEEAGENIAKYDGRRLGGFLAGIAQSESQPPAKISRSAKQDESAPVDFGSEEIAGIEFYPPLPPVQKSATAPRLDPFAPALEAFRAGALVVRGSFEGRERTDIPAADWALMTIDQEMGDDGPVARLAGGGYWSALAVSLAPSLAPDDAETERPASYWSNKLYRALCAAMLAAPEASDKPDEWVREVALARWGKLSGGVIGPTAFDNCWKQALEETGAHWSRPGRRLATKPLNPPTNP